MKSEIVVSLRHKTLKNDEIDPTYLYVNSFLKTLSLVEAARAGIQIPSTLLLVAANDEVIKYIIRYWKLPLIVRMDYKSLPKKKPLGGIPLTTAKSIKAISEFLRRKKCYPIFHPYLNRFENIYSAGILINRNDTKVRIEILGRGFDASDLRLGQAIPHEYFEIDVHKFSIIDHAIITDPLYLKSREDRMAKAKMLVQYIRYANQKGVLISSLNMLRHKIDNEIEEPSFIPENYIPLQEELLKSLNNIIWVLFSNVINKLPRSDNYAASLSYFSKTGWTLWDVYGEWYYRKS